MRSRINNYFIGELLQNASPFDVTKIKLTYNFTLFYGLSAFALSFLLFDYSSVYGAVSVVGLSFFMTLILYFLRRGKTDSAVLTYLAIHLLFGPLILFLKKGLFTPGDFQMGMVIVLFGWLTLKRRTAVIWTLFVIAEGLISILHITGDLQFLKIASEGFPILPEDAPVGEVVFPFLLATYMLWTFMGSKNKAEKIINEQKAGLEIKNREIHESLTYAKNIQTALLPDTDILTKNIPEHFVLYLPKEIVSGDFYWFYSLNENEYLIAVADCTGHGVPGAMVSVVCSEALTKSVKDHKLTTPGEILDKARELVVEQFKKGHAELKDGMDISLVYYNKRTNEIKWAGANNSIWYIHNKNLFEIRADKQPVGVSDSRKPFTTHPLRLNPGDTVYLFSDGYADQFGGTEHKKGGKKLKYTALKKLLVQNNDKTMSDQRKELELFFESWKGTMEQTDDVCVVGIKI